MQPENLRYTREHEWVACDGALAVIGITQHAQQALGDITFVELPPPGKALKAHDVLGVVESVKAASDVFAPIAGVVAEVNRALSDRPELINQDPYGAGWLCKLSGARPADMDALMTAADYAAYCQRTK
jgi:glycine cleavage system H protein